MASRPSTSGEAPPSNFQLSLSKSMASSDSSSSAPLSNSNLSLSRSMASSDSSEAPPSSPSEASTINYSTEAPPSSPCEISIITSSLSSTIRYSELPTPSTPSETSTSNSSTETKSRCSVQKLVANFKANFCVSKPRQLIDSSEAPPPSPNQTSTINTSTETKSNLPKFSVRYLAANFKAKFCVSKPEQLENHHDDAASSSATANKNDFDQAGGAISLSSKMIRNDLLLVDSAFAEAKKYMDHMNVKINQAHEKFEELQMLGSSQRDFDKLRKSVARLKFQIPSHGKIRSANSNPNRNRWPNINEAEDGMTHFLYQEPKAAQIGVFDGLILKAFHDLPLPLRMCLLCFFKFPPTVTIKRSTMIYLWIGQRFIYWHLSSSGRKEWKEELPPEEDAGNKIIDELIAKGFIEPVYQNCSLVPDSCRMSLSIRSTLYKKAEHRGFTSNGTLDLDLGFVCGGQYGDSCLINVGEAIIDCGPEIFENINDIQSLYLGRWQSLATHHIELAHTKILHGLKKLNRLTFLSLRGISMITELPTCVVELNDLKILDLCACHNLEAIPDNIGLLKNLTHLDMSECYFLEHMPESLAQLSNLQVLKGFFIEDFNNNKQSCTLYDLSRLPKLRKLNIYVSVKDFHRMWDFDDLKLFEVLQKLTISWGGCSLQGEGLRHRKILETSLAESRRELIADSQATAAAFFATRAQGPLRLPPRLQKLDLQCFPTVSLTNWLKPTEVKGLKKLYIRGGQLCDLGPSQKHQGEHWNVEILRLKYLEELEMDWKELRILFPKLIYLHQVECPKLTNFPCDQRGVWMNLEAIDSHEELQEYLRTSGMINSSSMLGSSSTSTQDHCNICPVDEKQL